MLVPRPHAASSESESAFSKMLKYVVQNQLLGGSCGVGKLPPLLAQV